VNKELLTNKRVRFVVILLGLLFFIPFIIYKATIGNSGFCGLCHMMKPEYYTHKASTHSRISCAACHIAPNPQSILDAGKSAVENTFRAITGTYVAPIKMLRPIDDRACERCHNMNTRVVSSSVEDLVIPHDKHKAKGINCNKCHSGVAHGNIANRRVTYEADYKRWDPVLGETLMGEPRQLIPTMDACMRCHELRKVTKACSACHPSGMMPDDHIPPAFKNGGHGKEAAKDLEYCNSCHGYMSNKAVEVTKEVSAVKKLLDQKMSRTKPKQAGVTVNTYARQNTFCKDCHGKRPPSHKPDYPQTHGPTAETNKQRCATCHDNQLGSAPDGAKFAQKPEDAVTMTTCGQCHPSSHYDNLQWKQYHPIEMPKPVKLIKLCYDCHNDESCGGCHGKIK